MKETEKAYLAGLIDGEGCITLTVSKKGQLPQPQLSISNKNLEVLRWVRQQTGYGSLITKKPYKANHSITYAWQINCVGRVTQVLSSVCKYLIIKKRHAKLIMLEYPKCTPRNGRYSSKQLFEKVKLVHEFRKLNQR